MENQVVLVTGASAGIGKAVARLLMSKGFRVYGTSRKAEGRFGEGHLEEDPQSGGFIDMIPLDVTCDTSVAVAVKTVLSREGKVDIVVNNAGVGIAGSVEDTSLEEARFQLETNYFGTLRVIREVLPVMREQGHGRLICISSVAGVISIPYQAHYSASKFAVEGLVEALRHEVAPFNIKVCLVEPGDTKTEFTQNRVLAKAANCETPYSSKFKSSLARMERDEQNGAPPEAVAKAVYRMIKRKNPPVRTAVGLSYKTILFLKRIVPVRLLEKAVGILYNS